MSDAALTDSTTPAVSPAFSVSPTLTSPTNTRSPSMSCAASVMPTHSRPSSPRFTHSCVAVYFRSFGKFIASPLLWLRCLFVAFVIGPGARPPEARPAHYSERVHVRRAAPRTPATLNKSLAVPHEGHLHDLSRHRLAAEFDLHPVAGRNAMRNPRHRHRKAERRREGAAG